jgi:acetyl-CoA carboxylase alpha subunit
MNDLIFYMTSKLKQIEIYLDFELPIKELEKISVISKVIKDRCDVTNTCKTNQQETNKTKKIFFKNLTAWQRVHSCQRP